MQTQILRLPLPMAENIADRQWLNRWLGLVQRYSLQTIILLACLGIASATLFAFKGKINSDLADLVKPEDNLIWYQDNEYFKEAFPDLQQTAIVVISGQDGNAVKQTTRDLADAFTASNHYESVFAPTVHDFLEQRLLYFLPLDKLEQWLKGAEFNYGPLLRIADEADLSNVIFSLADFIQANPGSQLPVTLDSLVNSLPSDELQIRGYYPLVDQNAKQHIHLILIKGRQDFNQQLPNSEIISSIRQTIEAEAVAEGIEVHLTGEVALADEELRAGLQGIGIAASVSAVLLAIIMVIGIRSTSIITAIFAMLIIGISLTLGFATLTIGSFNTLSMIFVVMFFGLGVDFAVHFSLRFQVGLRDGSVSSSLLSTSKDLLPALLLCTATSMLAFLSFAPTAYLGLAELGIISAGGMSIALFLTMTLLPAWFTQWSPATIVTRVTANPLPQLKISWLGYFVIPLGLVAAFIAKDVTFDYNVLAMRDENSEATQTLLTLQEAQLATDYSISVLADSATSAAHLKQHLTSLPLVGDVTTPLDFLPSEQSTKQLMLQETAALYANIEEVLPGEPNQQLEPAVDYFRASLQTVDDENRAQYQPLLHTLNAIVKNPERQAQINQNIHRQVQVALNHLNKMLTARPFSIEDIPAAFKGRLITDKNQYLVSVQPKHKLNSRIETDRFIKQVMQEAPNTAGRTIVEWGVGDVVVKAFQQAASLTFLGVSILLIAYFRKFILAVLVLIPIGLSVLLTLAICQLSGLTLNMANILVIPLIIGLGVDAGIHVVHRYQQTGASDKLLSFSTSKAVLISALTTIGTFFSLSFSLHKGAASVGLLLTIAISLMLLVTFLILPTLLHRVGVVRKSGHKI